MTEATTTLTRAEVLRRRAIEESTKVLLHQQGAGFSSLVTAWFDWQEKLPPNDARKRAVSTLNENKRESTNLVRAFGHLEPRQITRSMGYEYLEACLHATDQEGNPKPRPEKGNKEIALARTILEFAIWKGLLDVNPFDRLKKNRTIKQKRLVAQAELDLAVAVGRECGGARQIVALALKTAWLCVRRSVEIRGITTDSLTDAGIVWRDGKDRSKPEILIEWSPELRATVEEAKSIKRFDAAGRLYLFGPGGHPNCPTYGHPNCSTLAAVI